MLLNHLKKSLTLETTEFAVSRGIDNYPAFKWWVPNTFSRQDRVIDGVNKRIRKVTHTHGVEFPTSVT